LEPLARRGGVALDQGMRPLDPAQGRPTSRDWASWAVEQVEADAHRSADTHLIGLPLSRYNAVGIDFYFKDESTHPSGSLKHRLARSLFLYALCNGWLGPDTPVIEASSGSTAVSEAYFARLLGVPFIAVMPRSTSAEKVALIEFYGARCHFVERPSDVYAEARALAEGCGGHYMDQFTFAERATDWRGNNNIAESMFAQMERERFPIPRWIVVGAGTGGTSATIGRYVRYCRHGSRLAVADPEGSVFAAYHADGDASRTSSGSHIEGIGRPRVEPSFVRSVVDRIIEVRDVESVAAMVALSARLGRRVGPSTGTTFWAMVLLAEECRQTGEQGSLLSLICDGGERYLATYHDPAWVASEIGDVTEPARRLAELLAD
jgi:cysteine synthase A